MDNEYTIELNKEVALVKLNSIWQYPDKTTIVYYYTDQGGIDFLLAIGKASGFGPEFYSIVQSHEETLVLSIGKKLSDVATLIHDEKALCFCNPDNRYPEDRWYMIRDIPGPGYNNPPTREFTELVDPSIYRNLDDGFRWFYVNGVLRREDDNSSVAIEIFDSNIDEYIQKPTLDVNLHLPDGTVRDGNNYYLLDSSEIDKPGFSIRVFNYRGDDETDKYTISLGDENDRLEQVGDNEYLIWRVYDGDFELHIQATDGSVITEEIIYIWFPVTMYSGSCSVVDDNVSSISVTPRNIYHNLDSIEVVYNLNASRSILILPQEFNKFLHVYDINGLDYIGDYIYSPTFTYQNTTYQAYYKSSAVSIDNFRQKFTYYDDIVDRLGGESSGVIGGGGSIPDSDLGNYYTKAQIDELLAPVIRGVTVGGTSVVSNNIAAIPEIPTVSTNIQTDKTSTTKAASPSAVYNEVNPAIASTKPQGGFIPNIFYNLGTISGTIVFNLASPGDSNILNHYYWVFDTGSVAPTITWPSGLSWVGGTAPIISALRHYEISIINNIACYMEV